MNEKFFMKFSINTLALLASSFFLSGITISSFLSLVVAAVVFGFFNSVIKPIIIILTLPFNILTLGLFTLFINGFILLLTSKVVIGFEIVNFSSGFFGALLLSLVSFILNRFVTEDKEND